jgi:hypothetical protein
MRLIQLILFAETVHQIHKILALHRTLLPLSASLLGINKDFVQPI